ncbi:MAG: PaaI family thioesterase [Gammaproteobacteria bacterium]|nr:PaaI family thioesterase [Gammaproteobacteria bacterium]
MSKLARIAVEAKKQKDPNLMLKEVPYANFIGMKLITFGSEFLSHLPFSQSNVGNPLLPALHGGVVGGFIECSAIFTLLWKLDNSLPPKTIDFSFDYLRSPGGKDTYAMVELVRMGGRVANVRVSAWQDTRNKPVVVGNGNFLLKYKEE